MEGLPRPSPSPPSPSPQPQPPFSQCRATPSAPHVLEAPQGAILPALLSVAECPELSVFGFPFSSSCTFSSFTLLSPPLCLFLSVTASLCIEKQVNVRVEHIKHSKCHQEFLERAKQITSMAHPLCSWSLLSFVHRWYPCTSTIIRTEIYLSTPRSAYSSGLDDLGAKLSPSDSSCTSNQVIHLRSRQQWQEGNW